MFLPVVNAVASGGKPPLVYLWTLFSSPATKGPWIPISTSDPSTNWSGSSNVCEGETFTETWEIEVTDDNLDTASDFITVIRRWTDIS